MSAVAQASRDDNSNASRRPTILLVALVVLVSAGVAAAGAYAVVNVSGPQTGTEQVPLPTAAVPSPPLPLVGQAAYTSVDVLPSGDLVVQHWLHSRTLMFSLTAAIPTGRMDEEPVVATDLRVSAGGQALPTRDRLSSGRVYYAFAGTEELYVAYTLSGALVRSTPGAQRALARVISMDLTYRQPRLQETIKFDGARVLGLACAPMTGTAPVSCGAEAGGRWSITDPPASDRYRVMAQLDLPVP